VAETAGEDKRQEDVEVSPTQSRITPSIQRILTETLVQGVPVWHCTPTTLSPDCFASIKKLLYRQGKQFCQQNCSPELVFPAGKTVFSADKADFSCRKSSFSCWQNSVPCWQNNLGLA
jgi:hypothetical protein